MIKLAHNIFIHNIKQKIIAGGFALLIWYIATLPVQTTGREVFLPVAITYSEMPQSLVIVSDLLQSANVSAIVKRDRNINPVDFLIKVDLTKLQYGSNRFSLPSDVSFTLPPDTEILNVEPQFIDIQAEETVTKQIPLKATIVGNPAKGYIIEEINLDPQTLEVSGPKSKMATLEFIKTGPIDIENENRNFFRVTTPELSPFFRLVDKDRAKIKVLAIFSAEVQNIRIDNIPVGLIGQTYVTRINPQTINVVLKGPPKEISEIRQEQVQAFIDVSEFKPGNYKLTNLSFSLPDLVTVEKFWPPVDVWVLNQKVY